MIKKKVTDAGHTGPSGGGWYCNLSSSPVYSVPYGTWQQVDATVRDAADGSVVITLSANGKLLVSATDRGGSCGGVSDPAWTKPLTNAGKIGVRGDNANFRLDDVVVRLVE